MLSLVAAGLAAAASPVDCSFPAWDGNPIAWTCDAKAGGVRARGLNDLLVVRGERSARVTVSARVLPEASGTNGWATLGVALVDDQRNYWHLALVQAPPDNNGNRGGHFIELCEMKGGEWLAQNIDGLRHTELRQDGTWRYGASYDMALSSDPAGIRGEIGFKPARLGGIYLIYRNARLRTGRNPFFNVVRVILRHKNEEALGLLDALARNAAHDAVFFNAFAGGFVVAHGVASAAVEKTVETRTGAVGEAALLNQYRGDAAHAQVTQGSHARGTAAYDEDRGLYHHDSR